MLTSILTSISLLPAAFYSYTPHFLLPSLSHYTSSSFTGKARNTRQLPLLIAANTVNYGKAFKMNTAEALAAALYICGLRHDSIRLLSSFSTGMEFLKINKEALEGYCACKDSEEVTTLMNSYIQRNEEEQQRKEAVKRLEEEKRMGAGGMGGYMEDIFSSMDRGASEGEVDLGCEGYGEYGSYELYTVETEQGGEKEQGDDVEAFQQVSLS